MPTATQRPGRPLPRRRREACGWRYPRKRRIPGEKREALREVLAWDPRPHYQEDPRRVYGMAFAGMEVRFTVTGETLTVVDVTEKTS